MPDYDQYARRGSRVCALAARSAGQGVKVPPTRPLYRAGPFYARHEAVVK